MADYEQDETKFEKWLSRHPRLERAVTDVISNERLLLVVGLSAAAVVLGFGLWLANALFELTPWEIVEIAALVALIVLLGAVTNVLTPTKGTLAIAISEGDDSDADPTRTPLGRRLVDGASVRGSGCRLGRGGRCCGTSRSRCSAHCGHPWSFP